MAEMTHVLGSQEDYADQTYPTWTIRLLLIFSVGEKETSILSMPLYFQVSLLHQLDFHPNSYLTNTQQTQTHKHTHYLTQHFEFGNSINARFMHLFNNGS